MDRFLLVFLSEYPGRYWSWPAPAPEPTEWSATTTPIIIIIIIYPSHSPQLDPDIKREMQICHTQPHLVPPMRLVVHDDLPDSPIQPRRASTLPSRMMLDGKNLVSRASSIRTSMSIRRKSGIFAPPPPAVRISAPADFRRVQSSSAIGTGISPNTNNDNDDKVRFQPLELTIYNSSKHQLSDLPSFENFGIEEADGGNNGETPPVLARPARAFSSASLDVVSRSRRSNASFHLPRKPVGSGSRRASVATLEQLLEKQPQSQAQSQAAATNPLIPHFASTRPSSSSVAQPQTQPHASTPEPVTLQDRPFPRTPSTEENETPPLTTTLTTTNTTTTAPQSPPSATEDTPKPSSPPTRSLRSGRVTQWLFPTPPSSGNATTTNNINTNIPFSLSPPTSPSAFKSHFRHRSRTLSGSTLASQSPSLSQASPYPVSGGKYPNHNPTTATSTTTTYTTTPSFSSGTFTSTTTTTASTLRDSSDNHSHTPPLSPVPSSYQHARPPAGAGADSDQMRKGKGGLDTAVSGISRPAALDDIYEGEQMMPPRGFI